MPKLHVFACPTCGGSLSVDDGAATTRCQFCGNTVIVPEDMRTPKEPAAPIYGAAPGMAPLQGQGGQLKEMGNLIRAGNILEAIKLYRQIFGASLAEAQANVTRLAAGQSIQVMHMGTPTTIKVDRSPTASIGSPTFVPTMQTVQPMHTVQPVIITGNPGRSIGCVIWSVLAISGLVTLLIVLVTTGAMLPLFAGAFGGGLPDAFSDLATNLPAPGNTRVPAATRPPATGTPMPTPAFASSVLSFGGKGTDEGEFNDARHIGIDAAGNIYVGEWTDHRVQVFDSAGEFVTQWFAGEDEAILTSMSVAPDGTVYAVAGSQLYYYDGASGELLGQIEYEGTRGFDDVSVTPDGGLLVAFTSSAVDTILRYDSEGTINLRLPNAVSSILGSSELDMRLVADSEGEIYVLATTNDALFHFTPDGEFDYQVGGSDEADYQFTAPSEIAVDQLGRLYVTDFEGILVFDADGTYLDVFDVPDGGFIFGLAFDDENHLYAVGNNNMVHKFEINE